MKIKKGEMVRFQSVIEKDRLCCNDAFEELLLNDLNKLLQEYFNFKGEPRLVVSRENGVMIVKIELLAESVKNFVVIPEL